MSNKKEIFFETKLKNKEKFSMIIKCPNITNRYIYISPIKKFIYATAYKLIGIKLCPTPQISLH